MISQYAVGKLVACGVALTDKGSGEGKGRGWNVSEEVACDRMQSVGWLELLSRKDTLCDLSHDNVILSAAAARGKDMGQLSECYMANIATT